MNERAKLAKQRLAAFFGGKGIGDGWPEAKALLEKMEALKEPAPAENFTSPESKPRPEPPSSPKT